MLVDEYQDTNVAQYLWLRLLAQARRNLCCVGDDDQSIYGWRGAEVDNILRFEHDFPGATVVRLERNYRSTGHILSAASGLIAKNQSRLGKTLRTEDEKGEKVTITGAWDSEEEARLVGEEIEALQAKGTLPGPDRHSRAHLGPDAGARGPPRDHGRAVPGDRRPPLLRAGRDPRRPGLSARGHEPVGRPRLRADRQRAQARPRGHDDPDPARPRPQDPRAARGGGPFRRRDRRPQAQAARERSATSS